MDRIERNTRPLLYASEPQRADKVPFRGRERTAALACVTCFVIFHLVLQQLLCNSTSNDSRRQDLGHSTIRFVTNRAIEMHESILRLHSRWSLSEFAATESL